MRGLARCTFTCRVLSDIIILKEGVDISDGWYPYEYMDMPWTLFEP